MPREMGAGWFSGTGEGVPDDRGSGRETSSCETGSSVGRAVVRWCGRAGPAGGPRLHAGEHLVGELGEGLLLRFGVRRPCGLVPDLQAVHRTDDDDLLGERGVVPQLRRDGDAALLVRGLVGRRRREHPDVVTGRLVGHRRLAEPLGDPLDLGLRPHVETALLTSGDHEPSRQLVAELRREDQPALLVEPRRVGAEEHRSPPWTPSVSPQSATVPPLPSTLLHFPPPSTTFGTLPRSFTPGYRRGRRTFVGVEGAPVSTETGEIAELEQLARVT